MKKIIVTAIVLFVLVNLVSLALFTFFNVGTFFTDFILNVIPFAYLAVNGFRMVRGF